MNSFFFYMSENRDIIDKMRLFLCSVRPSDMKNAKKLLDGAQNRCFMSEKGTVRHVLGHFDVGRFAGAGQTSHSTPQLQSH
jgi:hypothetical protein